MKKLLAIVSAMSVMVVGMFAQEAVPAPAPVAEPAPVVEEAAPVAVEEAAPVAAAETTELNAVAEEAADVALDAGLAVAEFAADATVDALKSVDFPTGSWIDEKWDAEWEMAVAEVILKDATTGEVYYTFSEDNTEDWGLEASDNGVSLVFSCAKTHRSYKFTKFFDLDANLEMTIDPDWTDEDYVVTITFKGVEGLDLPAVEEEVVEVEEEDAPIIPAEEPAPVEEPVAEPAPVVDINAK